MHLHFLASYYFHHPFVRIPSNSIGEELRGPKYATLVDSNPANGNKLYVGLRFPTLNIPGASFVLGMGVEGNYILEDRILLQGSYIRPIFNRADIGFASYTKPTRERINKIRPFTRMEIGQTFFLAKINTRTLRTVNLVLAARYEGLDDDCNDVISVFTIRSKIPQQLRLGLRSGINFQREFYESSSYPIDTIQASVFDPVRLAGTANTTLHLGISVSAFQHIVVHTEEFGRSARTRTRITYFDLTYGFRFNSYFSGSDSLGRTVLLDYTKPISYKKFRMEGGVANHESLCEK